MLHKIGRLSCWNLTVCILVDSMESPEEEKFHLLLRVFIFLVLWLKMSTHLMMIGSVKLRNSWKSTFWSKSLSKSGLKPVVVTLCPFIICLQHLRYPVVVTNSEANSDKYQQVGRSHAMQIWRTTPKTKVRNKCQGRVHNSTLLHASVLYLKGQGNQILRQNIQKSVSSY